MTTAIFDGNAPTVGTALFAFIPTNFVVHYNASATGFASPMWTDSAGDTYPSSSVANPQTITFPPIATQVGPTTTLPLAATASSGLPVAYNIVSGPASISANSLVVSGLGTIVVTATQPGNGFYGAAPAVTQSFLVAQAQDFTSWENAHRTSSSPTTISQNDGLPNLLKYLYDIDPSQPMIRTDQAALPVVRSSTAAGKQYLSITFRENALATGIGISLLASSDLVTWTAVTNPAINQQMGVDVATGDPVMEMGVDVTNQPRQFIRLSVNPP